MGEGDASPKDRYHELRRKQRLADILTRPAGQSPEVRKQVQERQKGAFDETGTPPPEQ